MIPKYTYVPMNGPANRFPCDNNKALPNAGRSKEAFRLFLNAPVELPAIVLFLFRGTLSVWSTVNVHDLLRGTTTATATALTTCFSLSLACISTSFSQPRYRTLASNALSLRPGNFKGAVALEYL